MKNKTNGYPAPFQATFDREKLAFLELANRGDGLTPINYLGCTEGSFQYINVDNIISGVIEANVLYSNAIINQDTINSSVINTIEINVSNRAVIADIAISNNTINSTGGNIDFTNGINLHNGTDSFVCFLPASGVQQQYVWPSAPRAISPKPEPVSIGPYLTSDSNGLLSWTNTKALIQGGYTVGPYLTSDGSGNMSWDSYDVPAVDGVYMIGPFLSAKFGTGNLKWVKASVTVEIP